MSSYSLLLQLPLNSTIVKSSPLTILSSTCIGVALQNMFNEDVSCIALVDSTGTLTGNISAHDVKVIIIYTKKN